MLPLAINVWTVEQNPNSNDQISLWCSGNYNVNLQLCFLYSPAAFKEDRTVWAKRSACRDEEAIRWSACQGLFLREEIKCPAVFSLWYFSVSRHVAFTLDFELAIHSPAGFSATMCIRRGLIYLWNQPTSFAQNLQREITELEHQSFQTLVGSSSNPMKS